MNPFALTPDSITLAWMPTWETALAWARKQPWNARIRKDHNGYWTVSRVYNTPTCP